MAELKLSRVEPVHIRTEPARWERPPARDQGQSRQRQRSPRERLLAAVAPGHDPGACEFVVDVNGLGEPVGIVVRECATGRVLARVSNEQLSRLDGSGAPGGLFLEQKG